MVQGRGWTWRPLRLGRPVAYLLLALLVAAVYLGFAQAENGAFGFPLDDAWIHQVYSRNLGLRGEFAFFPGQPSTGSTSPLWALLLASGYAARVDWRVWTPLLGALLLGLSAVFSARLARRLGANALTADWLVPLFILLEWHLAWSAVSGMEIPLFVLLSLALVESFLAGRHPILLGVLAGLLTLTRPEGAVLGALVALGLVGREYPRGSGARGHSASANKQAQKPALRPLTLRFVEFVGAFALLLMPYAVFNLAAGGTLLPNTFYAKSQEYAELLARASFLVRWLWLYRQPLIGAQLLLVPGVLWFAWDRSRTRRFADLIPLAWVALLPALYAARLPVDYQFGRYEMPIIPFIGIYGIVGTAGLLPRLRLRVLQRAWALSAAALVIAFAGLGAGEYASSVAIVNCEMVGTARWTAANLPRGARIAAHDIGAQGYLDSHPLLDLAGLVSPEVIPFIRNETRLAAWMRARGAQYVIFFPDWYPLLAHEPGLVAIHTQSCPATRAAGGVNLVVYQILPPPE